jgi:thiamine-monophosphate kinase
VPAAKLTKMKLSHLGEFGLIHKIRQLSSRKTPTVTLGIGDDAAALKVSGNKYLLATTDMLIEDVHFDLSCTDFYSLGWKSAAVNLSDIAAMGGLPLFCLTSLGITPDISVEQISHFYRGFNALLSKHKTALVGGDTCSSRNDLNISVTVLGEVEKKRVVTRAGAKAGDKIFVTGTLGDSAAGLELLKAKSKVQGHGTRGKVRKFPTQKSQLAARNLIERHLRPDPRVGWGRKIALNGCANSMIDVSDGISSDLSHICEQSKVGALLSSTRIPLSPALLQSMGYLEKTLLHYALAGGEDYELLFTVPSAKIRKLQSLDIPVTEIGEITHARELIIADGNNRKRQLVPTGYNHFTRSLQRS